MPHAHKSHRTSRDYGSARYTCYPPAGRFTKTCTHRFERRSIQDIHLGLQELLAERAEDTRRAYRFDANDLYSFREPGPDEPDAREPEAYNLSEDYDDGDDYSCYLSPFDDYYFSDYRFEWLDSLSGKRHSKHTANAWRENPEHIWMLYEDSKAAEVRHALEDEDEEDMAQHLANWEAREDNDAAIVDAFKASLQRKYPRCKHLTR